MDLWNDERESMELEQTLITKKKNKNAYSVEREYINSKAFHDKFERLPVGSKVQQSLYIQSGRLLDFVDGQEEERLLAINGRTGEFLVDNFERKGSVEGTGFNSSEMEKVRQCKDSIILIHNHSLNGRPSARDLITYSQGEQVKLSLIVCHDGTLYAIYDVRPKMEDVYNEYLEDEKRKTADIDEAKRLATTRLYRLNDGLGKRHKLFDVRMF